MLGAVFERFVDHSPISVMVRGTLERVLGADPLDLWYWHTAQTQYPRDLMVMVASGEVASDPRRWSRLATPTGAGGTAT